MEDAINKKRVLVTGGAGVIGCELLAILSDKGFTVLSVDKKPPPMDKIRSHSPNLRHLIADISTDYLDEIIDFNPSAIFHLAAAFERSKESPEFWSTNWNENTLLSHRIIDIASKMPALKVFLFASSYLIYSPALYMSENLSAPVLLNENSPVNPRNITGASKYYTEKELEFINEYMLPNARMVNARIYRVYGKGSRDVISRWVGAALRNEEIHVYNRQNRFDFIYSQDVATGLYHFFESDACCGVINLGSGISTSVEDVLSAIASIIPLNQKDMGCIEHYEASTADITKLRKLTGWSPVVSIRSGIEHIVEYEKSKLQ
ncbi:MAG: NAD-dependent epimerase/dehydratase family protein [Nitrospirae bacterium YQR-1]